MFDVVYDESHTPFRSEPTTTSSNSPLPNAVSSSQPTDFSESSAAFEDTEFDDPEFNDPDFQHVLLTQEENLSSSIRAREELGDGSSSLRRSVLGALSEAGLNKKRSVLPQEFDDPEFDDPEFQHVLLTQEENYITSSQRKRPYDSSPMVVVRKKRLESAQDYTFYSQLPATKRM
jgi:hypothetical protein